LLSLPQNLFSRIRVYGFWIITILLSAALAALALVVKSKSKTIKDLQAQMALKSARLELEQVLLKHQATLDEVKALREKDNAISQEITLIETQLTKKLSPDMTAEQIAQKFREIGIQ